MEDNEDYEKAKTISEGSLNQVPGYYKTLSVQGGTRGRLKGLTVDKSIPVITEYLEGFCNNTTNTIFYRKIYKEVILVKGLLKKVNGDIKMLDSLTEQLRFSNERVLVGTTNFPVAVGDQYKLRVYSINL